MYFKTVQIRTPQKKSLSNQIVPRESFLSARTAKKLFLEVNKGRGMPLLSKNVKMQQPRNKLILYKSPVLQKLQPNLFQNCANWKTRQETIFKRNFVKRIVALCKNSKETFLKNKRYERNASIFKKFENTVPDKQDNSIQMSCILEDATKSISNLLKFEHQRRNRFQAKFCIENSFFVQELQEIFF